MTRIKSQCSLNTSYIYHQQQSMNTVDLVRLNALDHLNGNALETQLRAIRRLIANATSQEIDLIDMVLTFYAGAHKQRLQRHIVERKGQLSPLKKLSVVHHEIICRQIEKYHSLKFYFFLFLAICFILGFISAGRGVVKTVTQTTTTYVDDPNDTIQFTVGTYRLGTIESFSQKQSKVYFTYSYAYLSMGFVIVIYFWAFGFCGVKGYIDRDIERLQNQKIQVQYDLI